MSEAPTWLKGINKNGEEMERYDVAVIGGGPAGYKAALKLAELGKRVCIIDKSTKHLGGTCLNEGCIPVKSLLKASEVYKTTLEAEKYGVTTGECSVDLGRVNEKMRANVELLNSGLQQTIKRAKIDVIEGTASFEDGHTINTGGGPVSAEHIIIASGSLSSALPNIKPDSRKILTSKELLQNTKLPEKLLIIGGGVIGCEFATFYSRLGTKVTIVEPMSELVPNEDADAGKALKREFKKAGITSETGAKVTSLEYNGDTLKAVISGKKEREEEFDLALLAVGRRANLEGLALENAGVETENGHIKVNSFMRTSVPWIYAAGDAADGWMLAHTAYDEAVCAAKNIAHGNSYSPERTAVPRVVFSYPEIGAAGLTEEQAAEKYKTNVYKSLFRPNAKALIDGAGEGFVKIISDAETDVILGACIVGKSATELIHELIPLIKNRIKTDNLALCVHGHPTLSESVREALDNKPS